MTQLLPAASGATSLIQRHAEVGDVNAVRVYHVFCLIQRSDLTRQQSSPSCCIAEDLTSARGES